MRKTILLFFLMMISVVGHTQTAKDKSKPQVSEKAKPAVADKSKIISAKDTLKLDKPLIVLEPEIIFNDSVIAYKGKFRIFKKDAHASYYHNKFNGKRTASGRKFDNKKYTAAHRKLPFGTILRITNEENGKFVIVEITDRGPFSRGREIDLTRRAFMDIATNKNSGGMKVRIEIAN